MRIVMLGGSGFVGQVLARRLVRDGHGVVVLTRNRSRHREVALWPGVELREGDVYDGDWLAAQCAGADAVVNLVGILNESGIGGAGGREFERAHVQLTQTAIAAARRAGVSRLLQMSALNAGRGTSHYLRTRGAAEAAVQTSGLRWTIFRPSVIFGRGDGLFCRFAELLKLSPLMPLAGADARFQPVAVEDVAEVFVRALGRDDSIGQIHELGGPEVVTLADIVRRTAHWMGLRRIVLPMPKSIGWLQAAAFGLWPFANKPLSLDNFRSLAVDSVVTGEDALMRLGIAKTAMAQTVPGDLAPRPTGG
jgi:NADH dehydrogenase